MKKQLILLCLIILCTASVWSAAPTSINFQGLLTDSSGTPLGDGSYSVLFLIYDVPTGGSALWSESKSVDLVDGLFTTNLGSVTPLNASVFDSSPRYLGVQVGANPELLPRTLLVSVPWSLQSSKADTADFSLKADTAEFSSKADTADFSQKADTANFSLASASAGGSIFTRWGNSTAPAGTELIYSGYVFGSHFSHAGPQNYTVIQTGDTGLVMSNNDGILYPTQIETGGSPLLSFIQQSSKVKAAVCYSNSPTLTIWGTHTPPSGWTTLYTGYAMGPLFQHVGPAGGPICVDHLNFEPEVIVNQNGALLYAIKTNTVSYGVEVDMDGRTVKCVVCKKD